MTLKKTMMLAAVAAVSISPAAMAEGNQSQLYNYNEQAELNSENINGSVSNEAGAVSNIAPAAGTSGEVAISQTQKIAINSGIIEDAQASLQKSGYAVSADGVWGPKTASAVREFQQQNGLTASGQLDAQTLAALDVRQ